MLMGKFLNELFALIFSYSKCDNIMLKDD